ncbi:MAG: carbon-nitrogen hydrolase family protein, partial [Draconibacterium sp.]|nr:carbon-nitrogen hydrolase family protein [Draconibacterium sp.]
MKTRININILTAVLFLCIINFSAKASVVEKEGKTIKVAMLQMNPDGYNIENNLKKGEEYCRKAKELGADIALFPEIWSLGYSRYHWENSLQYSAEKYPLSFEEWKNSAMDHESDFITHFRNLAKELEMAIAITYLEKWDGLPRNSVSLIDAKGEIKMTYAKVHTSDMKLTESNCTPGDDFYVCDLQIGNNTIKVGAMICFDREFPESARILMLKGAELVLTPNACGLDDKRINQFQTRAYENAFGVIMTNYASPSQNGRSCAFDANG